MGARSHLVQDREKWQDLGNMELTYGLLLVQLGHYYLLKTTTNLSMELDIYLFIYLPS